jgi:hypothetical protein
MSSRSELLLNTDLLQSGAMLGVAVTRLEGSLITSLTYLAASEEVARCRTPDRWAATSASSP